MHYDRLDKFSPEGQIFSGYVLMVISIILFIISSPLLSSAFGFTGFLLMMSGYIRRKLIKDIPRFVVFLVNIFSVLLSCWFAKTTFG